MKLVPIKKEEFLPFYQKMEAYFIYDERRDYASSCNVFNHKEFTFYAIEEKNQNIGFISVWECKEFTYIEHFAIDTAYRKQGYGGKAIDMILNRYPFVILEIELPEDEMKKNDCISMKSMDLYKIIFSMYSHHITKMEIQFR